MSLVIQMKFVSPTAFAKGYTCPHCGAFAEQKWWAIDWDRNQYGNPDDNAIRVGQCMHCKERTLWLEDRMLFPNNGGAPPPNAEMPKEVTALYREASEIILASPRGAAALLRLAVQVLCKELGGKGDNINDDIRDLVKKGLPTIVQQSLDIVRVTGNNAVHPGQIDVDDVTVCSSLFKLLNVIVEYMIAMPNKVSGLYSDLPASALNQIGKRDAAKN